MNEKKQHVDKRLVRIPVDKVVLEGNLDLVSGASGIVLFAHGSGSSRFSPRNRYVAEVLNGAGLATLLIDLLTSEEEAVDMVTRHIRFDIKLLAGRLIGATDWLIHNPDTKRLRVGYFGASTGAAAALMASVEHPDVVEAIVSRGGRPDLAGQVLSRVKAPTLLIVGGNDDVVIDINKEALDQLCVEKKLIIVPGATHLFEEPGKLEEVARHAANWFMKYLSREVEI